MSEDTDAAGDLEERTAPDPPPAPRPAVLLFATVFVAAMIYNLAQDGSDAVTIFLGCAAMLTLGIDVGKITGRR